MCGFAGKLGSWPGYDKETSCISALNHRGPDGSGVWREEGLFLSHTRLKIIDLSDNARQPMRDEQTGVVLVYNGEVYNYRELRSQFRADSLKTTSDTEVLLKLFLRDGIRCVDNLRGMFAFAIWDPRVKRLYLVRDRFGIKPLFISQQGSDVYFGSEVKALCALGAPCEPNLKIINDYLVTGRVAHSKETFFQGIYMLGPGEIVAIKDSIISSEIYWTPTNLRPKAESLDDVEHKVLMLVEDSVQSHLVSDVPVGIALSGGIDSEFITRMVAGIGVEDLHSFTYGFEDENYDEIPVVQSTNYGINLTRHYVRLKPENIIDDLSNAIHYFEMPLGGLGTLSLWRLMEKARSENIPVLLSGEGADEIFGGYQYYRYARYHDLLVTEGRIALERELEELRRSTGVELAANDTRITEFSVDQKILRAPDGSTLGGQNFLGQALIDQHLDDENPQWISTEIDNLRQTMLNDVIKLKLPKLLWYQDRAAMSWGIEARPIFLDHNIIEYVYTLPPEYFFRGGETKSLLKDILRIKFGINKQNIEKDFVSTPQREWLKGSLAMSICDYLDEGVLVRLGLINYPMFRNAYKKYIDSDVLGNSFFVWKILNMELFMRKFFPI